MDHLELGYYESRMATEESIWSQWSSELEKRCGFDLDGHHAYDGYSIDACYEMFCSNMSVEDAFQEVFASAMSLDGVEL